MFVSYENRWAKYLKILSKCCKKLIYRFCNETNCLSIIQTYENDFADVKEKIYCTCCSHF